MFHCVRQVSVRRVAFDFISNGIHGRQIQKYPIRQIYRGKDGGISVLVSLQNPETFVASLNDQERVLLQEALSKTDQLLEGM